MLGAIHSFKRLPDIRRESGVPKLMVVFTDGVHVVGPDHAVAVEMAAKAGIITCSFGIGDSIDDGELLRIANNDTNFTFRQDYHGSSQEQIVLIARQVKTVPQTLKIGSETVETLRYVGEKRYYRFGVPTTGTTITLINEEGETRGYWTFTAHQPSSAVRDGVITEGETFIKPPLLLLGFTSNRDIVIVFESFANNSRMRIWIDEGDTTGTAATNIDLMLYLRIVIFCSSTALLK
ncbi:uncharacterized protein [Bemisia tabaci]|uniref:uncharacterized protein n=1 Tax=Bemisia tabaci TaxID=7038 RepID=UPI003B28D60C